jgi:uncharacterized protein
VPGGSFFLFGPRGTGKSTWLEDKFPDARFIDLLDDHMYRSLLARPETMREIVLGTPRKETIVIDEVQRVPNVLSEIHKLMEEQKGLRCILTGSSSRKLKQSGIDLLAGRAIIRHLYPFIAAELKENFCLKDALSNGLIPLILQSPNRRDSLEAYISLYLKEEVQAEGIVRNVGNFARFLEIMSFSHGQLLNLSEIARESEVKRHLVEEYVGIVEDLLIGYRIHPFLKRAKRIMVKSAKFYFFDPSIYSVLRPTGPLDRREEVQGAGLEGLVLHHLLAWMEYANVHGDVFFWRTKSGNEVDFVVYGNKTFFALEVKHANTIRTKDLQGLKSFRQDYPEAKTMLLYLGNERLRKDSIHCLPCETFLEAMTPNTDPFEVLGI